MSPDPGWREAVHEFGSVVCVSTADFNAPLWTNKQHLMTRLSTEVPVLYVESLGLRRPRGTRRDAERMMRRLCAVARPQQSERGRDGVAVASPVVVPFHGFKGVRRLNRAALELQLKARIERLPRPRLLWTYSPVVVDELELGAFDAVLYHAVDDLASVPGMPAQAIDELERALAARADAVLTSAESLAAKLVPLNANTHAIGNAADLDHFRKALDVRGEPRDIADMPRPRVVFAGALTDYKIDWDLFSAVARALPSWGFVIVGPVGDESAMHGWKALADLPNCRFLGHRPYDELPDYLGAADVGVIPYRLTEHTGSVLPLKLVEYLAAGLGVVATPLDALRRRRSLPFELADNGDEFVEAIRRVDTSGAARRARSASVADRSWDALLDRMFAVLSDPEAIA
jgi:glycosyltransferase involved in cell wall biosynthesis